MESHKNNMNKARRQDFFAPERRGTEFLLGPPDQRPVTEPITVTPPKNQSPRVIRAKAEKFLSVTTPIGVQSRNSMLENRTKPVQLVNKYFTNTPQLATKIKPRKTMAEKSGLKPIIPTDAQRQTPLKYQKSPDQASPQISWNTPDNGARPIPPGARDIARPGPDKITTPMGLSEPARPKTPGRRQDDDDEEINEQSQPVHRKELKNHAAVAKQKALVEPQTEPYYLLNKNFGPGRKVGGLNDIDEQVMYIFTPPREVKNESSDESNEAIAGSDDALLDQPGYSQNINLTDLAQNAQRKAQRFGNFRDDALESYESVDMLENSPGLKNLTFESELKMPEKPITKRKKIAEFKNHRTLMPRSAQYDSEFKDRPITARPATAHSYKDETGYSESDASLTAPHKLFETEDINILTDKATLKVNNLHDSLGYDDLMALFPKATSVTYPMYDRSGPPTMKPTRYCYILYDDVRDANEAFEKMDAVMAKGMVLDIEYRHYNS